MTYVITQNCCNDASCVAACPVGCIHPTPDEPGFGTAELLHIDPATCIDCGACADACPVDAIRPDTALTPATRPYLQINAAYYQDRPTSPTFQRRQPFRLVTSRSQPLRVAVVGSGAAGYYCAKELLVEPGVEIDMYERLPEPFGLIRFGVAPDHAATRAVVNQFRWSAEKQRRFRLHLDTEVGVDISHDQLLADHHAVIYAYGAFNNRRLGIPGEDLPGSMSAGEFVGWYNGHPDHRALEPDLSSGRVVVIGNGNVALDVARILVSDPDELACTDTAQYAVEALRASQVDEVIILGRRGREDASFTAPELLGLQQVPGVNRITFRFHAPPAEIIGDERVRGVRIAGGEVIEAGLVIRAIGFEGRPMPGVPFDPVKHTIPHVGGA